jgi:hypothetical protein
MPGSLPAQSRQMDSSQPSQQSQYHTQASTFPFQQELNSNWTKVSYKQGRSTQDETERTKHTKDSKHWLNQTSTSNHYTALLEEKSEDQQHKASLETTPKPPPLYITGVKNISPLIQLLEQIAKSNMKLKLLQTISLKFSLKLLHPIEQL